MIPLKQYTGDDWIRIAAQNNALRAQNNYSLWTSDEVWALYRAFFGMP